MGRVQEKCLHSMGLKWCMLINKMDQQRTICPSIWAQLRSPIFKLGERLVCGVIGSALRGPRCTDHLLRTIFEDCAHGAATQCSAVLMNLHNVALRENYLPEEFIIGADNTPTETKNQIMIWFLIWLLCVLEGSPLWSLMLLFLIVGHTHNRLDRFFSRLGVSLAGRDYYTLDNSCSVNLLIY